MAEVIPSDFFLLPSRYLIQEDSDESCIATIIQSPPNVYGRFPKEFSTTRRIPDPDPEPGEPSTDITIEYTKVIFKREGAQEVNLNGTDYFIVHCNDILAFIPPEE